MKRSLVTLVCVSALIYAIVATCEQSSGEEPGEARGIPASPQISLQLRVVELNVSKLRNIGVDIGGTFLTSFQAGQPERADEAIRFMEVLVQNDWAWMLGEPRLVTVPGRTARLSIADQVTYELLPTQPAHGRIGIQYSITFPVPNSSDEAGGGREPSKPGRAPVSMASRCECTLGKTELLGCIKSRRSQFDGPADDTLILVLLQSDYIRE